MSKERERQKMNEISSHRCHHAGSAFAQKTDGKSGGVFGEGGTAGGGEEYFCYFLGGGDEGTKSRFRFDFRLCFRLT